jgi:hypothetical protein
MTAGIITRWAASETGAWTITLTTSGGTVHVACGDIAGDVTCPSDTAVLKAGPGCHAWQVFVGAELYAPASGQVTRSTDITIISSAVDWTGA